MIVQHTLGISRRRTNRLASKLHSLLGDRLRPSQIRHLLLRLGASIQNSQLRIVLNLNSGVAKMRGEDHRQRTIRTHPVNAIAAEALGAGLGKRSVAVTGQTTLRLVVSGATNLVSTGVFSGEPHLDITHEKDGAETAVLLW